MMVCNQQATLNPVGYTIFIFFYLYEMVELFEKTRSTAIGIR